MVDDPQQALNAVRLMQLEERLDELAGRIDNLVDQVAVLNRALKTRIDGETVAGTAGPAAVAEISPGMAEVIKLIQQGQGEQAQQALYELPEDELSSQPGAVALVAAALFVQRGDLEAGLKALHQARQLTDDPRLLALTEKLEEQLT